MLLIVRCFVKRTIERKEIDDTKKVKQNNNNLAISFYR